MTNIHRILVIGSVLIAAYGMSLPLAAQVAVSGNINGAVTDSSGAGIAGATVTATGSALMSPRTVRTQSDGSFLIDRLPVGTYEVRAEMAGFKALVQNNVALSAGFTATLNLKVEVGDITQSVTVESASPLIDVTSAQNTTAFNTSLLENIPPAAMCGRRLRKFRARRRVLSMWAVRGCTSSRRWRFTDRNPENLYTALTD